MDFGLFGPTQAGAKPGPASSQSCDRGGELQERDCILQQGSQRRIDL